MQKRGGTQYGDLLNNIMNKIITNDLAATMSFAGKQKKEAFRNYKLASCVVSKYTNEEFINLFLILVIRNPTFLQKYGIVT